MLSALCLVLCALCLVLGAECCVLGGPKSLMSLMPAAFEGFEEFQIVSGLCVSGCSFQSFRRLQSCRFVNLTSSIVNSFYVFFLCVLCAYVVQKV